MTLQDYSGLIREALRRCLDHRRPYVLWDFPNYSNVGDSAIWLGEIKALQSFFGRPPFQICECLHQSMTLPALEQDVQIILSGGGNFGDLWKPFQLFRERVVAHYSLNRIVLMPQTIHFSRVSNLNRCRRIFLSHSNLCIMARDIPSFEIAQTLHNGQTELVPDMAFALGKISPPCKPSVQILALLRSDKEMMKREKQVFPSEMPVLDWLVEPKLIEGRLLVHLEKFERLIGLTAHKPLSFFRTFLFNRMARVRLRRGCAILARGKVVITDRLHGHILCVMMNIPHVVLDNSYGKIASFREAWRSGCCESCLQASSIGEALVKARYLLHNAN